MQIALREVVREFIMELLHIDLVRDMNDDKWHECFGRSEQQSGFRGIFDDRKTLEHLIGVERLSDRTPFLRICTSSMLGRFAAIRRKVVVAMSVRVISRKLLSKNSTAISEPEISIADAYQSLVFSVYECSSASHSIYGYCSTPSFSRCNELPTDFKYTERKF